VTAEVLGRRALNRTLLERQLLLRRSRMPALGAIERLVAVQGQEPNWPYVGLWTRLENFRRDDLTSLLHNRRVVRGPLIRSTQHLAGTEDFLWLRPLVQPVLDRTLRSAYFARETAGMDLAELADAGRELLADRTITRPQLGRLLAERFPGRDGRVLAAAVQLRVPVVHPPPSGTWGDWGSRGAVPLALAEAWIGRPMTASPRIETMIGRYLAAFGPASVMDIQTWSGLTRLRGVVDGMRPRLRVFRDERGRELFDLPDVPLADPDLPVPVRFLPAFDNLLLGHTERSRVISDEDRKRVMPGGAIVRPTFLVDGFVRGTWSLEGTTLLLSPFRQPSEEDAAAVLEEAERLLDFVAPDAEANEVRFVGGC
jgi:winged helix DNA-binding protein